MTADVTMAAMAADCKDALDALKDATRRLRTSALEVDARAMQGYVPSIARIRDDTERVQAAIRVWVECERVAVAAQIGGVR